MILAVAASVAMLSACHTSGKVDNFTINVDAVSSATTAVDVPYKVANGYFVRNDVKKLPNGKISKQKDFEASFGMAAVMGNDGRPTEIDFNNQYVIAVSKPVTDRFTELEPVSLKGDGDGGLVFVYRTKRRPTTQLQHAAEPGGCGRQEISRHGEHSRGEVGRRTAG